MGENFCLTLFSFTTSDGRNDHRQHRRNRQALASDWERNRRECRKSVPPLLPFVNPSFACAHGFSQKSS